MSTIEPGPADDSLRSPRPLRLGLVGAGIARSMAPRFHRRAGELTGRAVTYDLLEIDPGDDDRFEGVVARCIDDGYDGLNVTFPFKERAAALADVAGPDVARLGAVNTLLLPRAGDHEARPTGHNTDFTGLCDRWRRHWPDDAPGVVALLGAGGVGRAAAFALTRLGADAIRIIDVDGSRAARLAAEVASHVGSAVVVAVGSSAEDAVRGADGVVNATPVGMYFAPGVPVALDALEGRRWLFDAVYSPLETELLAGARARGVDVMSGFELFLGQGFDAWTVFAGAPLPPNVAAGLEDELWRRVRDPSPRT